MKIQLFTRGVPGSMSPEFRCVSPQEIVEVVFQDEELRACLFAMVRERAILPLLPWQECEGRRWLRATATGPAVAWVYPLHAELWAFHLDVSVGGTARTHLVAVKQADALLAERGWTIPPDAAST